MWFAPRTWGAVGWLWVVAFFAQDAAAFDVPSDSIFVDGKTIRVQASVEIDTVSRPKRWQFGWNVPGPDERRPIKRKAPAWNQGYALVRTPLGGESMGLEAFTSGVPATGWGAGWDHFVPRPGKRPWGFGWSLEGQWMPSASFGTPLPDSLIGFLPQGPDAVWAVTQERFDIGVETDTLSVPVVRTSSISIALNAALQVDLSRQTPLTLTFGLERWSADRTTFRVAKPGTPSPPVLSFVAPGAAWQPVARLGISRSWGGRTPRWSAGASLVWRPAEAQSLSARVQFAHQFGR